MSASVITSDGKGEERPQPPGEVGGNIKSTTIASENSSVVFFFKFVRST